MKTMCNTTVCPGSSDPFYIVTYYTKWVTTSWTYCILNPKKQGKEELKKVKKIFFLPGGKLAKYHHKKLFRFFDFFLKIAVFIMKITKC